LRFRSREDRADGEGNVEREGCKREACGETGDPGAPVVTVLWPAVALAALGSPAAPDTGAFADAPNLSPGW
jgi:hypothetical protein